MTKSNSRIYPMFRHLCRWTLAIALLAAPMTTMAAQSYDNCTGFVTSLPAVITTQGTWCMKQDLATAITSGNAISINTNNVTLDCNDFKLGGLAAGAGTTAIGVFAADRFNLVVRHCNIRGFLGGVVFGAASNSSSGGHVIEDNRFDGNTVQGIHVEGDGSVVRRNLVFDTAGSTAGSSGGNYAIDTYYMVDIIDNTVSGVAAPSGSNHPAGGIVTTENSGGQIAGNRVRGIVADGSGAAYGIINITNDRLDIRDNSLVGPGSTAVSCSTTHDAYKNNLISAFGLATDKCVDAGGNTAIP